MAKDIRIDIGFVGGGSTAIELPEDQLDTFTGALQAGGDSSWFVATSTDGGTFHVDLTKVQYVRIAKSARSIGFGSD